MVYMHYTAASWAPHRTCTLRYCEHLLPFAWVRVLHPPNMTKVDHHPMVTNRKKNDTLVVYPTHPLYSVFAKKCDVNRVEGKKKTCAHNLS